MIVDVCRAAPVVAPELEPLSSPIEVSDRCDGLLGESRADVAAPCEPSERRLIAAVDALFGPVLVLELVSGHETMNRQAPRAPEIVLPLPKQIVVSRLQRLRGAGELERQIEIPPPSGEQPPAMSARES